MTDRGPRDEMKRYDLVGEDGCHIICEMADGDYVLASDYDCVTTAPREQHTTLDGQVLAIARSLGGGIFQRVVIVSC